MRVVVLKLLLKRTLQVFVPAALLAGMASGVRVTVGERPQEARLLILGRMVGERVRVCRDLTPEERQRIPLHMQSASGQQCEQSMLAYRLRVWVDGVQRTDLQVRPAGVRGDRPVYVHEELSIIPGEHALRIAFDPEPAESSGADTPQGRALAEAIRQATRYPLEGILRARAGQVVRAELDESIHDWRTR
jgi:hypothetical protein